MPESIGSQRQGNVFEELGKPERKRKKKLLK
jgi:hypothetical protein